MVWTTNKCSDSLLVHFPNYKQRTSRLKKTVARMAAAPQRTLDEVNGWSEDAVASWARGSGLSAAIVDFLTRQVIDGETMLELTEANLVAYSLPLGHAKKLLRAISTLKAEIGE